MEIDNSKNDILRATVSDFFHLTGQYVALSCHEVPER